MGINVNYAPVGAIGGVAAEAGKQKGISGALQDALQLAQYGQRERFQNQNNALQVWSQRFSAANSQQARREQNYFNAGQQEQELGFRAQEAATSRAFNVQQQKEQFRQRQLESQQTRMERLEMLSGEEGMRNRLANSDFLRRQEESRVQDQQTQKMYEMRLSEPQKRQQMELQNRMEWVNQQPGWTDDQKQDAINQLQHQWLGIQPMPKEAEQPPWPEGRDPGLIWEQNGFEYSTEVDANKNIKVKRHGPVARALSDRQLDRQPYQRGFGVYQYDETGKEIAIVPPPQMPDLMKLRSEAIESIRDNQLSLTSPDGSIAPPTMSEDEIQEAAELQVQKSLIFWMKNQQFIVDRTLGLDEASDSVGQMDPNEASNFVGQNRNSPEHPYFRDGRFENPDRSSPEHPYFRDGEYDSPYGGQRPFTEEDADDPNRDISREVWEIEQRDKTSKIYPGASPQELEVILKEESRKMTERIKAAAKQKMENNKK